MITNEKEAWEYLHKTYTGELPSPAPSGSRFMCTRLEACLMSGIIDPNIAYIMRRKIQAELDYGHSILFPEKSIVLSVALRLRAQFCKEQAEKCL